MHGYSQPSDYRFSHDSIELAQRVAAEIQQGSLTELRVLDLCAGCGVVGLELARLTTRPLAIDFIEVQNCYQSHFDRNVEWIKSSASNRLEKRALQTRWMEMNYAAMPDDEFAAQYDVVVANPPYFDRERGKLPPSDFKARCRFFIDSDFATLLQTVSRVLRPNGSAYLLVRELDDNGVSREDTLDRELSPLGRWTWLTPIRGTGLVKFVRASL